MARKRVAIDKNWLQKQYIDNKLSTKKIAKLLGCSASTVELRLKQFNIQLRASGQKPHNVSIKDIERMYLQGKSSIEIAKILNVSTTSIQNRLKKYNITRTKKESAQVSVAKRKATLRKKYGVDSPIKIKQVKEKIKNTNIKKYGVENPLQNSKIRKKAAETFIKKAINNNKIVVIEGKTLSQLAQEKKCSYSTLIKLYNKSNNNIVLDFEKQGPTNIELILEKIIKEVNIDYISQKYMKPYRPDFIIEKNKLIIEANGLWYHSENYKNKKYHINKKNFYLNNGYKSLFFNSDELLQNAQIVKSIIQNKIGNSYKLYARNCDKTQDCDSSFFKQNHLMGKGLGRIYCLKYKNTPVSAIQVKWKNKETKELEISRFCHVLNYNIVGGFSKLYKWAAKDMGAHIITTFIDRRYGEGDYLTRLGWIKKNEDLSFKWTKGDVSVHRMRFPKNSGYKYGYLKIWDCGQAKYSLIL